MTDFAPFHDVINEYITNPNSFYDPDFWWEKEIKQFASDIDASIEFIKNECTDEEIYWLGEVFEEIIETTQSKELLDALGDRAQKIQDEARRKDCLNDVKIASEYIRE